MPSAFWYSWSKAVSFAKETGRLVIYADEREKCRHLAQTVDKCVNTAPDAPTARHTAPHKNGGEPHQKSVPAPPKSTHSSCLSSRTTPPTLFHRQGGAKRRRQPVVNCRRYPEPGANDYIFVLLYSISPDLNPCLSLIEVLPSTSIW